MTGIWDEPSLMGFSPIKTTEATFKALLEAMYLPAPYRQAIEEAASVFTEVHSVAHRCCPDMQSMLSSYRKQAECTSDTIHEGFILQNRHNRKWHFSASFSYCPTLCLTRAFIHGLAAEEMQHVTKELEKHRGRLALPMTLPTILVSTRLRTAMLGVRDCHREIVQVERKTGLLTKWDSIEPLSGMRHRSQTEAIDFNAITADITSVTSKLAYAEYLCEIWLPKIAVFDRINCRMLEAVPAGSEQERLSGINRGFQDEIALLQTTQEGVQLRAKYISKRAQAQVQTVSHDTAHIISSIIRPYC